MEYMVVDYISMLKQSKYKPYLLAKWLYTKCTVKFRCADFYLCVIYKTHIWHPIYFGTVRSSIDKCWHEHLNRYNCFLHDRSWLSPWVKSISNALESFTSLSCNCWVIVPSSSSDCDVTCRIWSGRVQKGCWCVRIVVIFVIWGSVCHVRN